MCKKVPAEVGVNKIEQLHNKVKLLNPNHFAKEAPKLEAAVIRLTHIPKIKDPPLSPVSSNTADADNVSWALNGRTSALPYTV